jgi:hypothetical protein
MAAGTEPGIDDVLGLGSVRDTAPQDSIAAVVVDQPRRGVLK